MSRRILVLISSDRYSGPGVPALAQAAALRRLGHAVHFVCKGGRLAAAAAAAGVPSGSELDLPRRGQVHALWQDRARLAALAASFRPDLVFVHRTVETLLAGWVLRPATPVVRVWHDGRGRRPGPLDRWWWRRCGIPVLATTACGAAVLDSVPPLPDGTRPVLVGAVDTERFHPRCAGDGLRRQRGLGAGDVLVVLPARWKKGRDLGLFLSAFAAARAEEPRLAALLVGAGELQGELARAASGLGQAQAVHFHTPEDDFVESLAAADVGVLMAPGSDGTARAALELMALGKPVVVPAGGAFADLAGTEQRPGAWVVDSLEALAQALVTLAREPELRLRRGTEARTFVLSHHTGAALEAALAAVVDGSA